MWERRYTRKQNGYRTKSHSRLLEKLCGYGKGKTALDIACGTGRNSIYLCKRGWRVVGVDISHRAISRLEQRLRQLRCQNRVKLIADDIRDANLGNQSFDLVLMSNFYDEELIEYSYTLMKKRALFILETFTAGSDGESFGMNTRFVPPAAQVKAAIEKKFEIIESIHYLGKSRYAPSVPKLAVVARPKRMPGRYAVKL